MSHVAFAAVVESVRDNDNWVVSQLVSREFTCVGVKELRAIVFPASRVVAGSPNRDLAWHQCVKFAINIICLLYLIDDKHAAIWRFGVHFGVAGHGHRQGERK